MAYTFTYVECSDEISVELNPKIPNFRLAKLGITEPQTISNYIISPKPIYTPKKCPNLVFFFKARTSKPLQLSKKSELRTFGLGSIQQ